MNSNRNLIVALIALWCYTRNCNINLANNTAILLILYALLRRPNFFPINETFDPYNVGARPFRRNINPGFAFPFQTQQCQATPCCPVF